MKTENNTGWLITHDSLSDNPCQDCQKKRTLFLNRQLEMKWVCIACASNYEITGQFSRSYLKWK